jgi:hypothetical protein
MRTALSFLPLLRPFIIREQVSLSMIGHWVDVREMNDTIDRHTWAFLNLLEAYRPAE